MSIKYLRPSSPRPAAPRTAAAYGVTRPPAKRVGEDRAALLEEKLQSAVQERRRLAAAGAGLPESSTQSSGAMNNTDLHDHIRAHIQQKGSWIERRIARLQSEVRNSSNQ